MQRQKKQFLVMVILLVIGIFAYLGVRFYNGKQEEKKAAEEEQSKTLVTDFKSDDITSFSYQYEGELLEFVKEDGTWYYKGDRGIAMDQDQISYLLDSVSKLNAETKVSDYDTLADYGLDKPQNMIVLTAQASATTLLLGNKNEMLSQYYVKTEAEPDVYLISISLADVFGKSVSDLTKAEENTEKVRETEDSRE